MAGRPITSSLGFVSHLDIVPAALQTLAERETEITQQMDALREEIRSIREKAQSFLDDLTPNQVKRAKAAYDAANPKVAKETKPE